MNMVDKSDNPTGRNKSKDAGKRREIQNGTETGSSNSNQTGYSKITTTTKISCTNKQKVHKDKTTTRCKGL